MRADRTAARLFIVLPSKVDRYSETYGPTDFGYCLLAALLGPNRSRLAIERVGLTCAFGAASLIVLRSMTCSFAAALVEQGSKAHTALGEKTKWPHKGAISFSGGGASPGRRVLSALPAPFPVPLSRRGLPEVERVLGGGCFVLCSQWQQPDIVNFPYSHTLTFKGTVRSLPGGFKTWRIQH